MSNTLPAFDSESGEFDALEKALLEVQERLNDALIVNFWLRGETLKSILNGKLTGEKIQLGVFYKDFFNTADPLVVRTLKNAYLDFQIEKNLAAFTVNNIPVELLLVKRKFKCLECLDQVLYVEFFKIPNPLKSYFQQEGIIK